MVDQLPADAVPPGHPFTCPQRNPGDLDALEELGQVLRSHLEAHPDVPVDRLMAHPDGRPFRMVLPDPAACAGCLTPLAVGFCGFARLDADREAALEIDQQLRARFPQHPGVLAYLSGQRPAGSVAADLNDEAEAALAHVNLVVVRDLAALEGWDQDPLHRDLAVSFSPRYYRYIRLHRGVLEGGIRGSTRVRLRRTLYLDFRHEPAWKGLREYP